MMRHRLGSFRIAAICLLISSRAWAAGMEFPDNGAISIGRGGAYAAKPIDGMALTYNPAGFADQRGLRITIDSKLSMQNIEFQPQASNTRIASTGSPFFAPGGVVSYGFGRVGPLSGLSLAIGAVGPSAIGKQSFPQSGAQRYSLISSDFFVAYYSAAVAASFGPYVAAGVTMQLAHGTAKFSQAVYGGDWQGTSTEFDAIANISVTSGFIPTGVIGVTVTPTPKVAVGMSYRPHYQFSGSGTLDTQLPKTALDLKVKQIGNKADLALNFPDVVRLGVQVRPTSALLLESNIVYERWSVLDSIVVTPKNISIDKGVFASQQKLDTITLPKNFRDAVSVRVGGDYALADGMLTLRAGYLFETSAIPKKTVAVDFANWGRHVASAGCSVAIGPVFLDAAYAHHFIASQNVTNSAVQQVTTPTLSSTDYAPATVVGNGRYSADLNVFSLALRVPL